MLRKLSRRSEHGANFKLYRCYDTLAILPSLTFHFESQLASRRDPLLKKQPRVYSRRWEPRVRDLQDELRATARDRDDRLLQLDHSEAANRSQQAALRAAQQAHESAEATIAQQAAAIERLQVASRDPAFRFNASILQIARAPVAPPCATRRSLVSDTVTDPLRARPTGRAVL